MSFNKSEYYKKVNNLSKRKEQTGSYNAVEPKKRSYKSNFKLPNMNFLKDSVSSSFSFLGPVPAILIIIFVWRRYGDIEDFFNRIFTSPTNFYKGRIKDLPEDKEYYKQIVLNIVDGVNDASTGLLDSHFFVLMNPFSPLENEEIQYITDIYSNPEDPTTGLVAAIKNANKFSWADPTNQLASLKQVFKRADIPF
jgi:hypothetical protein